MNSDEIKRMFFITVILRKTSGRKQPETGLSAPSVIINYIAFSYR